jgi:hypothetical protein
MLLIFVSSRNSSFVLKTRLRLGNFETIGKTKLFPTTCQQDLFATGLHVASLLTSCDNVVPTTCQQDVFAIGL